MSTEDKVICSGLLTFIMVIVGLLIWGNVYKEIPTRYYSDVEKWSEDWPEVRGMILDATADGFIDNHEYRQIENTIIDIKKQRSIRNMNRERKEKQ